MSFRNERIVSESRRPEHVPGGAAYPTPYRFEAILTLPRPSDAKVRLPKETRRIVEAVRKGRAGGMFPPIAVVFQGSIATDQTLAGDDDARVLAHALMWPQFGPFVAMIEELGTWCREVAQRHIDSCSRRVLRVTNAELFGPLLCEAFSRCAVSQMGEGVELAELKIGFQRAIEIFFVRFERDARAGLFAREGFQLPIAALGMGSDESHNGGQRVLRVRFRSGGSLAYKARPASGEQLFLAENGKGARASVFARLNAMTPTSGGIRLPTLRVFEGRGRDRSAYAWQEWIERPTSWATLREARGRRLEATQLAAGEAGRFWHRAGSLSAACFAFGIVDLSGENVMAGAHRRGGRSRREPMFYAVDTEIFFHPVDRLWETALIPRPRPGTNAPVAFEKAARWYCVRGTRICFLRSKGGALRLVRAEGRWVRNESRCAVADEKGHIGFGAHLGAFLRGMFDVWTLLNSNKRSIVRSLARASKDHRVRVLPKTSKVYIDALTRKHLGFPSRSRQKTTFSSEEMRQLARGDVPYFFRRADGGPLLAVEPASRSDAWFDVGTQSFVNEERIPPSDDVRQGSLVTFVNLGVALRDAVAYGLPDIRGRVLEDRDFGVRVELLGPRSGKVSFDWVEAARRLTYRWNQTKVRLSVDPIESDPTHESSRSNRAQRAIRKRLMEIDRIDDGYRARWVKTDFADRALEKKLDASIREAVAWLEDVIEKHGWPGFRLVGKDAADAACRLVQHAKGHTAFQERCLSLVEEAARRNDMTLRHVAYLTDAVRVNASRYQLYGTKFRKMNGTLVPYPIEDAARVDERRERMGMGPLAHYTKRLHRRFLPSQAGAP